MEYFKTIDDATPIEDISSLIPTHILNRDELNEWEANNILKATKKFLTKSTKFDFSIESIKEIHKEMFDKTWQWAGKFRTKNYNIGVNWHNIQEELKKLFGDLNYWQKKKTFDLFQQSIRLHHKLVQIHPFVNGNGRHARLAADIFLFSHGQKIPIWPNKSLIEETDIRKKYINALKSADTGDYSLLEQLMQKLL
ncbi:MAG: mobile mystery protein B [Candidatus Saganbacteria bacterium]|uniref:Mobile mystery protein B n=1 Tax=Candidatus Saganbacteria bacterium TaxID=2575572 RepID=A0A833L2Y0_UNCSA|nr:MAG: mobile mystery protein B [Candidatus Saganbacteria bacterium]